MIKICWCHVCLTLTLFLLRRLFFVLFVLRSSVWLTLASKSRVPLFLFLYRPPTSCMTFSGGGDMERPQSFSPFLGSVPPHLEFFYQRYAHVDLTLNISNICLIFNKSQNYKATWKKLKLHREGLNWGWIGSSICSHKIMYDAYKTMMHSSILIRIWFYTNIIKQVMTELG